MLAGCSGIIKCTLWLGGANCNNSVVLKTYGCGGKTSKSSCEGYIGNCGSVSGSKSFCYVGGCVWTAPCYPNCSGKECGPDGCGGSCGTCTGGKTCNNGQCVGGGPGCNATSPTNLNVTRLSPTQAQISWTPGANGTEQRLYAGANKASVETNCPGTDCVVKVTGLPTSQTSYTTGSVFSPNTVYYWRVLNYKDAGCLTASSTKISASSCDITPSTLSIPVGSTGTLSSLVGASADISSVNFSSGNAAVASVNPATDASSPYQTIVSGVSGGSTNVTANVIIGGATNCSAQSTVNVTPPQPWWQTVDADLTITGNLTSSIPSSCTLPGCNPLFDLIGGGGYPGIPAYSGTASFGSGSVSTPGWLANTTSLTSNNRQYTYAWFKRLIPADVVMNEITSTTIDGTELSSGGTASGGYYYYHYDGSSGIDLTINTDAALGTRRVILLVDGADLNLNARINFTKGQGFFMALVGKTFLGAKGNINVSSTLGGGAAPQLEGLYEADNAFHSGAGTTQLYIRGSVAAYGGINLERDLTDNSTTPAEVFEYAPDLVFTYPYKLRERRIFWQEVAP